MKHNDKDAIHCLISGKVQGVFFRSSTKLKAEQLGLTGWVRNLPDGQVEVLACGSSDKLSTLQSWLQKGPLLAKVNHIITKHINWEPHKLFVVR